MSLEDAVREIVDARIRELVGHGHGLDWGSVEVVAAELGISAKAFRTRIGRGWLHPQDVSREGRRVCVRRSAVSRKLLDPLAPG